MLLISTHAEIHLIENMVDTNTLMLKIWLRRGRGWGMRAFFAVSTHSFERQAWALASLPIDRMRQLAVILCKSQSLIQFALWAEDFGGAFSRGISAPIRRSRSSDDRPQLSRPGRRLRRPEGDCADNRLQRLSTADPRNHRPGTAQRPGAAGEFAVSGAHRVPAQTRHRRSDHLRRHRRCAAEDGVGSFPGSC